MKTDKENIKRANKNKILSTQRYLQFASVHDDTLVLKDGGLRAIIEVSAVNFDLKSEAEQNALVLSYQYFLNALNFPAQIVVRSRKLDIDQYIAMLKEKMQTQKNELLKGQMGEYIEYIQKLVEYTDIMEKRFFIVIPQNLDIAESSSLFSKFLRYITPDDTVKSIIERKQKFEAEKAQLDVRVNIVKTGIENCGMKSRKLKTEEIIELFYQAYNPDIARGQKLEDVNDFYVGGSPEDNLVVE